jgi:hypothetical protein
MRVGRIISELLGIESPSEEALEHSVGALALLEQTCGAYERLLADPGTGDALRDSLKEAGDGMAHVGRPAHRVRG